MNRPPRLFVRGIAGALIAGSIVIAAPTLHANEPALAGDVSEGDAAAPGPHSKVIATGLERAAQFTIIGAHAYWLEGGSIKRVPTRGGTPTTLFTNPEPLNAGFTTDGTSLYFVYLTGKRPFVPTACHVAKIALDGTHLRDLTSGTGCYLAGMSLLAAFDGTVYIHGQIGALSQHTGILAVTSTGTVTQLAIDPNVKIDALYGADARGVYFGEIVDDGSVISLAPRGGGAPRALFKGRMASGDGARSGAALYIANLGNDGEEISRIDLAKADGGRKVLASFPRWIVSDFAADAAGLFVSRKAFDAPNGTHASPIGIYAVSTTTGAKTLVESDTLVRDHTLALDASHVYWIDTDGTLHAKAR
jgi:hypothetical protein